VSLVYQIAAWLDGTGAPDGEPTLATPPLATAPLPATPLPAGQRWQWFVCRRIAETEGLSNEQLDTCLACRFEFPSSWLPKCIKPRTTVNELPEPLVAILRHILETLQRQEACRPFPTPWSMTCRCRICIEAQRQLTTDAEARVPVSSRAHVCDQLQTLITDGWLECLPQEQDPLFTVFRLSAKTNYQLQVLKRLQDAACAMLPEAWKHRPLDQLPLLVPPSSFHSLVPNPAGTVLPTGTVPPAGSTAFGYPTLEAAAGSSSTASTEALLSTSRRRAREEPVGQAPDSHNHKQHLMPQAAPDATSGT